MYAHLETEADLTQLPTAEGAVVARALSKEPGNRWQTCMTFVKALIAAANARESAVFYYNRGMAWRKKKDFDKAVNDFDEAIRLDPKYVDAYEWRGLTWEVKKDYEKATKDFDEANRLRPNAFLYFYASRLRMAKGDYDNAIKGLNEAIRLDPNETYYCVRAEAWYSKKDYDKAIKDFDEAIVLDPKCTDAFHWLAWVLATCPKENVRDGKRAIRLATKACDLTDWKSSLELSTLAAAYAETGQFDEAERYQMKALEDPTYRGKTGDAFRQRLQLYKQKKPYRQSPRQRILVMPLKLEINISGELSIRPLTTWRSVVLAKTPGIIEISATTLIEAHVRKLAEGKERFEKLRGLKAPDIMLQNEIRMINQSEEDLKSARQRPQDHAYQFKAAAGCTVTGDDLVDLSCMIPWEKLDLAECSITDKGLATLCCFSNLQVLCLSNCVGITDEGLVHVAALAQLVALDLTGCSVTDRGLASLSALKQLEELTLKGLDRITQDGVVALKAALPECEINLSEP
jgi:tetratricopeptide (TPR) repeat protein